MTTTKGRQTMDTKRIALSLALLGGLFAATVAGSQEPPPYPGNEAAGDAADAAPPPGDEAPAPAPADDPAAAGIDYFHQQLSPYGQWVVREGYGMVWVPDVAPGWRPYTTGHWVYTDQGWAWVADEPWGWAAFHYGRWFYDADLGWAWVPGTVWAPAWVAWRHGGGYLGWAPLPPAVGFSFELGLDFGGVLITPGFYTFVAEREILAPRVAVVIVPSVRNVTIVNTTTNITTYTVVNNRVVNAGVSAQRIEQVTGRPVPRLQVVAMASARVGGRPGAFYQPPVVARAARVAHAEFGKALPTQMAAQCRSRAFAKTSAASTASAGSARSAGSASGGAGAAGGGAGGRGNARAKGAARTGSSPGSAQGGSQGASQSTTGAGAGSGQGGAQSQSARGHYAVGTSGSAGGGQGQGAGSSAGAGGHSSGAQGQTGSQEEKKRSPSPPPQHGKDKESKEKEKDKDKEHKPPPL
jgi:hypothetical protein